MPTVHILWLKPEDYPRFRAICSDVDDTYEEWRARMDRALLARAEPGIEFERVIINPDEFAEWCRVEGREIGPEARAIYPAYRAMLRAGEGPD